MSLLSEKDIQSIKEAIKTVTDTFFKSEATYLLKVGKLNRWGEDREGEEWQEFTIPSLSIFDKSQKGQVEIDERGMYDLSEGYALLNAENADEVGLLNDDKQFIGNPATDRIRLKNTDYQIFAINEVAPIEGDSILFKIQFRRFLK